MDPCLYTSSSFLIEYNYGGFRTGYITFGPKAYNEIITSPAETDSWLLFPRGTHVLPIQYSMYFGSNKFKAAQL